MKSSNKTLTIIIIVGVIALIYWLMTKNKNTNKESGYLQGGPGRPIIAIPDCGCPSGSGRCRQVSDTGGECDSSSKDACCPECPCGGAILGGGGSNSGGLKKIVARPKL